MRFVDPFPGPLILDDNQTFFVSAPPSPGLSGIEFILRSPSDAGACLTPFSPDAGLIEILCSLSEVAEEGLWLADLRRPSGVLFDRRSFHLNVAAPEAVVTRSNDLDAPNLGFDVTWTNTPGDAPVSGLTVTWLTPDGVATGSPHGGLSLNVGAGTTMHVELPNSGATGPYRVSVATRDTLMKVGPEVTEVMLRERLVFRGSVEAAPQPLLYALASAPTSVPGRLALYGLGGQAFASHFEDGGYRQGIPLGAHAPDANFVWDRALPVGTFVGGLQAPSDGGCASGPWRMLHLDAGAVLYTRDLPLCAPVAVVFEAPDLVHHLFAGGSIRSTDGYVQTDGPAALGLPPPHLPAAMAQGPDRSLIYFSDTGALVRVPLVDGGYLPPTSTPMPTPRTLLQTFFVGHDGGTEELYAISRTGSVCHLVDARITYSPTPSIVGWRLLEPLPACPDGRRATLAPMSGGLRFLALPRDGGLSAFSFPPQAPSTLVPLVGPKDVRGAFAVERGGASAELQTRRVLYATDAGWVESGIRMFPWDP